MKIKNNLFAVTVFFILGIGCQVREATVVKSRSFTIEKKSRLINYRDVWVPEEGGTKFTKFSEEYENIRGPKVTGRLGVLNWYSASFLDISPDGKKLAYIGEKDKKSNIYLKNTFGGKATIQRTYRGNVSGVVFSPDGKHLAFDDYTDDDLNISQINSNQGAAIQQITNTKARESCPAYSPDGKKIFYTKGEYNSILKGYKYYIWSYDLNSSLSTQYAEGFASCVSKDGNVLYITRNDKESGNGEIWSVNIVSGESIRILDDAHRGFSTPRVSPDGKRILVVGSTSITKNRVENLDVYTINKDGTNLTQLTFHPGHDVSPVWGPKGDKIYFVSQRGSESGSYGIWMMNYIK